MIDNDVNNEIHQGDNDGKICSADNKAHDNPILHNEPTMKTAFCDRVTMVDNARTFLYRFL